MRSKKERDRTKIYNLIKIFKKNKFIRIIFKPLLYVRNRNLKKNHDYLSCKFDAFLAKLEHSEITIRFDDFQAKIRVGIHSTIVKRILLYGEYEQTLTHRVVQYLNKKKDVIDVGANVGLFTVLFSKIIDKGNRVLAIEPTLNATKFLEKNILQNNCSENVIIFTGVAVAKPGDYVINTIAGMEEYSSLGQLIHSDIIGQKSRALEVPGQTIDALVKQHSLDPGFIKIDTEGAELSVITGAQETLKHFSPIILAEVSDRLLHSQGGSAKILFKILRDFDYRLYNAYTMNPVLSETFDGDILALPKNSPHEMKQ